jgi:hypothetical protein
MTITRDHRIELFVSKFCQWASNREAISPKDSKKLASALRRFVFEIFPDKSNDYHLGTSELVNSDDLILKIISQRYIAVPSDKGKLLVGVFTPDWSQGLRKYLKNENIYDLVSGFFHFAEQYVRRSILVELMGAVSVAYNKPTNFYSSSFHKLSINPICCSQDQGVNIAFGKKLNKKIKMSSPRQKFVKELSRLINGLDPYIHRLIFNFIRAQELRENSFAEESITALDKALNVAEQFLLERLSVQGDNQRETLGKYLNLNKSDRDLLEHIYQLRCFFGGHPAISKWWDFAEIYPEENEEFYFEIVKKVIIKIIQIENQNRKVEKQPKIWGDWFKQNWKVIWESCWFEKLPV